MMVGRRAEKLRNEVCPAYTAEALLDVAALLRFVPEEILPLSQFLARTLGRVDGF